MQLNKRVSGRSGLGKRSGGYAGEGRASRRAGRGLGLDVVAGERAGGGASELLGARLTGGSREIREAENVSRRQFMVAAGMVSVGVGIGGVGGCARGGGKETVTLYTSSDAFIAKPIIERFELSSGISVKAITDTEATKTTGLIGRLLLERERPTCDVWWSNELLGTAQLAAAGLLAPMKLSERLLAGFGGTGAMGNGWPAGFCDEGGLWYGHGLRVRVVAYHPARVPKELTDGGEAGGVLDPLNFMVDPVFKGRIGMARPQFGTTRMQMVAWAAERGIESLQNFLEGLKANEVRLYHGNSAVIAAVAHSEVTLGLTDSDDAAEGLSKKWPVASVPAVWREADGVNVGPLVIPNTVAIIKNCPRPKEAAALAEFLLSSECEEMLAVSSGRNIPLRGELRARLSGDLKAMWPAENALPPAAKALTDAQAGVDALLGKLFGA